MLVWLYLGEGFPIKMASEIYRKNRSWLFAEIKEHLPDVVSCLCDEGILSSDDRDRVTRISEQATRLLDVIHKKINSDFTPFDFAIKFARVLEKTNVSSSHLADFIREMEGHKSTVVSQKSTVVSRKNSLDSGITSLTIGSFKEAQSIGNSEEAQSSIPRRGSTGSITQQINQKSKRRCVSSDSLETVVWKTVTAKRKESFLDPVKPVQVSESSYDMQIGVLKEESYLKPVHASESSYGMHIGILKAKQGESYLTPVECSELDSGMFLEMPVGLFNKSTRLDHFMDTVLKASQELHWEDKGAASKVFYEIYHLYCERNLELTNEEFSFSRKLQKAGLGNS